MVRIITAIHSSISCYCNTPYDLLRIAVRNHERGYKLIESSNIFYEDFVKDLSGASISIHNEEFR